MKDDSEELRSHVRVYLREGKLSELAQNIGVDKSTLSLWLSAKYKHDPASIEKKILAWFRSKSLSRRDQSKLVQIHTLVQSADAPEQVVQQLQQLVN